MRQGWTWMHRLEVRLLLILLIPLLLLAFNIKSTEAKELRFLAIGYTTELVSFLNDHVIPEFEAKHGVQVSIELTDWNNRMDKILVANVGGVPYDIVSTGFYSPYEEGSSGLLAPLDDYIRDWDKASEIAPPMWEALQWEGQTYVIPQNASIRSWAYNKQLFEEAGLDPESPPQSWEDLIDYVRRLTRTDGAQVQNRGIAISTSGTGAAQQLFWFLRQAGRSEVNVDDFTSNLDKPEAVESARTLLALYEAARGDLPGVTGGFAAGHVAMQMETPVNRSTNLAANPELEPHYGLFSPRKDPDSQPVSHAYINGLGITAASQNKDIAWAFIARLHEDETLFQIELIRGFFSGRRDIAQAMMNVLPKIELFYDSVQYIQPVIIPPPRNIAQQRVGELMRDVYNTRISPEEAMLQSHELWTNLLSDWKNDLGR